MRYGEDVGIVINIITRKVAGGYVLGASGTLVPKADMATGNPNLIMTRREDHTLMLTCQSPRLYAHLMTFYRHNARPAMQHVYRTGDNRFVKTYLEGRRIDVLMSQAYASCDILPQRLNAYFSGSVMHCRNDGQDYSHRLTSFNYVCGLMAWLGNWTVMAEMDNGCHFMENEYEGRNIFSDYVSVSYRWKRLTASLFAQNLFMSNRKIEEVKNTMYLPQNYSWQEIVTRRVPSASNWPGISRRDGSLRE